MPHYYVDYTVDGFGECRAGPYALDEARTHLLDIGGYEGVRFARITFTPTLLKTLFEPMPTTPQPEQPNMRGRLFVTSSLLPQLGAEVVVKLAHGWYHGTVLELGPSVLVVNENNFFPCRAAVQDPLYPPGEPSEPEGHYDCLEWAHATWPVTRKLIEELRTSHQTHSMMRRAEAIGLEYIVGVAIRVQDRTGTVVYRLGWPARHHTILNMLSQTVGVGQVGEHDQGFWTSRERYVSRRQAADLARAAGQTVSQRSLLFSEDLW